MSPDLRSGRDARYSSDRPGILPDRPGLLAQPKAKSGGLTRDLNKSDVTHQVTDATALWLDAHGFKPVETEVSMPWYSENRSGWIADLAAVISPTQTELIELKLIPRKPRWPGSAQWTEEHQEKERRWQEVAGLCIRFMTCLVEVKTTRADFRGDHKWKAEPPADLAFLAVPKGLLKPEEWPAGWGILEWEGGTKVGYRRRPEPRVVSVDLQLRTTLAIAIRRDHHTRYARMREWRQEDRQEKRARAVDTNLRRLAAAVLHIAQAKHPTIEVSLALAGVHKPAPWLLEQLRPLWGIARAKSPEL